MKIRVVFDGKVLVPEENLDLEPCERYEITIGEKIDRAPQEPKTPQPSGNLWDLLEELGGTIEGPEDWSVEHDHYLYGTPKRSEKETS